MHYLICDRCGSHYELPDGESANDYECVCGGNLRVADSVYGDPKKENPHIKKFISNKPAIIGSFLILSLLLFGAYIYFTPTSDKLESSLPDNVGAYYVPQSMQQASSITGLPYDSRFNDPSRYYVTGNVQSVEKTYIRNGGPFEIRVSILTVDDTSADELDAMYESMLYSNQKLTIAGKDVDCIDYVEFGWHGDHYIIIIDVLGSDYTSYSQCYDEGINFLNSFIPEFEKTNKFN